MIKVLISNSNYKDVEKIYSVLKQLSQLLKVPMNVEGYLNPQTQLPTTEKGILDCGDYDIIFLNLDDQCNCMFGKKVRNVNSHTAFVISSENMEVVKEYTRLRPSMFYTKLDDAKAFAKYLARVIREMELGNQCFVLKNSDEIQRIPFENILYFETDRRNIILHTNDRRKTYRFVSKMEDLQAILPSCVFVRCHQSYIVNQSKIQSLDKEKKQFILNTGASIDISRRNYHAAVEAFTKQKTERCV